MIPEWVLYGGITHSALQSNPVTMMTTSHDVNVLLLYRSIMTPTYMISRLIIYHILIRFVFERRRHLALSEFTNAKAFSPKDYYMSIIILHYVK